MPQLSAVVAQFASVNESAVRLLPRSLRARTLTLALTLALALTQP